MTKCVWILNHYAIEPGEPGGTRHYDLACALKDNGWQAVIIASSVVHVTGRQRIPGHESFLIERYNDIPFVWLKGPSYKGNGGGRLINMLAYTFRALFAHYRKHIPRPDVIIGSSVHPLAAVAGLILSFFYRVPFVFEVRDLWPQTLIDMGRLKSNSIAVKFLRLIELWLYKRAKKIIVLLPAAGDYITPLGVSANKILWIPNGVALYPLSEPEPVRNKTPFTLMYFGAHGQANGIDTILKAMKFVSQTHSNQKIWLRLVGDGPLKSQLMTFARELGLDNVSFESPVPKSQISLLASTADAFVISVLNLPELYRFGISMNKIFDYLAAGKPIVIALDAANNPIEESGAGISVSPDSPEKLAEAVVEMYEMDDARWVAMGRAGRTYVELNHGFDVLGLRLVQGLNELLIDSNKVLENDQKTF